MTQVVSEMQLFCLVFLWLNLVLVGKVNFQLFELHLFINYFGISFYSLPFTTSIGSKVCWSRCACMLENSLGFILVSQLRSIIMSVLLGAL